MTDPKPKRLYRSYNDKMIAGVCGGLAAYFNLDPVLVRILFVILLFAFGTTLLVYIILWIVVPYGPVDFDEDSPQAPP